MRFFCIGDEDAVRGFRLAGVPGRAAAGPAAVEAALDEAAALADCGVVLIARRAADMARAKVDQIKLERARPLIVEI